MKIVVLMVAAVSRKMVVVVVVYGDNDFNLIHSFIHSFIQAIFIAPLQVYYYSEALLTQHGYCVTVSRRSATGNFVSEGRGGQSGIRTHDPSDEWQ